MSKKETSDLLKSALQTAITPGVYLLKDKDGKILYVGKALNLQKRLSSYFRPTIKAPKTAILVDKVHSLETILTQTENEAFLLESTLIKKHRPTYNVIFKDDKRYLCLYIDMNVPFPTIRYARQFIHKTGVRCFGPFSSVFSVHETVKTLKKLFPLRQCRDQQMKSRSRPCLNYQIKACLGPCCNSVNPLKYQELIDAAILFLEGKTPELIREFRTQMHEAAKKEDFETAAYLRDKIFALEKILEKQIVISPDEKSRDIISLIRENNLVSGYVLKVRSGVLLSRYSKIFPDVSLLPDGEILEAFLQHIYEFESDIPNEIILPFSPNDRLILEAWLSEKRKAPVHFHIPTRGNKARWVEMASQNAKETLQAHLTAISNQRDLLYRLQKKLHLPRLPKRIECFDNASFQGANPVGAMVVFIDAKPYRQGYRRFKIRNMETPDDYKAMFQILSRRYKKVTKEDMPDLVMIDGGKGHLSVAVDVLKKLDLTDTISLISIAKKEEKLGETQDKIYLPVRSNSVVFGKDTDLLLFLENIRNETHRSAITFHRQRRRTTTIQSVLSTIEGVGPKRQKQLLSHFGSVAQIKLASIEEITSIKGFSKNLAEIIWTSLQDIGA